MEKIYMYRGGEQCSIRWEKYKERKRVAVLHRKQCFWLI